MSLFIKKSQTRQMLSHAGIYATGNLLRQLTGFLMLPVYTRHLTPADYGVVSLMIFAISLMELVFGGRLYWAVPKFYADFNESRIKNLIVSTAMIITATMSLITVAIMITLRDHISAGLYGTNQFSILVSFFSVLLLTQSLEQYSLVYLRLQKRPWLYISVNLIKLIIQLALNILFVVYLEMGALGVAISAMLASSIFALILTTYTLRNVGIGFSKEISLKLIKFCWPLWLSGFAGLYIGSIHSYYLRIFSSLDNVGLFELAAKFGSIVAYLVWEPFATYWQVERFNIYRDNNAKSKFQKFFYFISSTLVITALGVAIFSKHVIQIMAGHSFHLAADAVPYLAFSSVFSSLIIFMNFSFFVKEKTGWLSRNNYVTAIIITFFYFILIPHYGFIGASFAMMLAHFIQFLVVFTVSRKFYDMEINIKPLLLAVILAGITYYISRTLNFENYTPLYIDISYHLMVYALGAISIISSMLVLKESRVYIYQVFLGIISNKKAIKK